MFHDFERIKIPFLKISFKITSKYREADKFILFTKRKEWKKEKRHGRKFSTREL